MCPSWNDNFEGDIVSEEKNNFSSLSFVYSPFFITMIMKMTCLEKEEMSSVGREKISIFSLSVLLVVSLQLN